MTPPAWAQSVIAAAAPPQDYESIAGDLCEEYAQRIQADGRASADAWYCSQALRSIPSLLAYSRWSEAPWKRGAIALFVAVALVAMLVLNELADDVISHFVAPTGRTLWTYFLLGWLDAAFFGFLITATTRSHGARLALISALALVAFIALPVFLGYSSPLTAATWLLLLGAVPAMIVGAALFQMFRRR